MIHSATTIAEKYRVDLDHSRNVAEVAVRLFDLFQADHGLDARHRLLLRVASLLHEVGSFVSSRSHHKHSEYLIANSELFGLNRNEIALVSQIARYHRRSVPRASHLSYMALTRESRVVVNKLAAILRVADALVRGHRRRTSEILFQRRGDELLDFHARRPRPPARGAGPGDQGRPVRRRLWGEDPNGRRVGMPKNPLKSPNLYLNRELSWLEFNHRVLEEGLTPELPLLERLKFLAIVNSNLDEFFLVRVAWLMRRRTAKVRRRDIAGMTAAEQLAAISRRVHGMVDQQAAGVREVLARLAEHGLHVWRREQWTERRNGNSCEPTSTAKSCRSSRRWPMQELTPGPLLPNLQLNVAGLLAPRGGEEQPEDRVVIVPVPAQLPRLVSLPAENDVHLVQVEDVIAANLTAVFPGCDVAATAAFRITRDADVILQDDEEVDEPARRDGGGRLVAASPGARAVDDFRPSRSAPAKVADRLAEASRRRRIRGRRAAGSLDADGDRQPARVRRSEDRRLAAPGPPRDLIGADDLWEAIEDHDVLLFHPYESFDPVVKLVEQAAEDPQVLAIKQTLYRTSGDSPIIRALARAAQNGKEVTALVELKARFDEWRNVNWARRLEDAGVHVIYGVAGFKTHCQGAVDRAPPVAAHPSLRTPGHGQL